MNYFSNWDMRYDLCMARIVYYLSLGLAYLRQIVNKSAFDHRCQPLIARRKARAGHGSTL